VNVLDLFSGIGGFSLGLERAGMRTLAFCESDPDCVTRLHDQWPHVPVFGDVRTLSVEPGFVDLICGGFPCQPYSTAARGRNNAVDLWPEFIRIVRDAHPDWVAAENVSGMRHAQIERVSSDLEAAGYYVWTHDLDTALPQRQRGRYRLIWLAYTNRKGEPRFAEHAEMAGLSALSRFGEAYDAPPLGMDDGLPGRMDRLRMLGNAITPDIAEAIGLTIMHAMNR
jgi:DNA (cytosine-5)-methyltransferase 1